MSKLTIPSLRRFNLIAGIVHLLQMAAVIALSTDFSLPVTATYMTGPPGSSFAAPVVVFETPLALAVALFLGLSAIAHFIVASPQFFGRYGNGLQEKRNYFRWVEYSISSSVMIVLIAQITGIADISALIAIFGVNASMILFGWLQEKYEQPGNGGWVPFTFGCIAGIVPWLAVLVYVLSPGGPPETSAPGFVIGIIVTIFVLFNSFAWVQYKQYKAQGKWSNYLHGERIYIVLSLVAKSLLAWQIFANTLIP
ncbi:MAG: heliorhodopsin HeR [Actinobacteria bacterium]|nr:heliorhodopsin HeR [Actinomycetota bacterium]